jgi:hypothetical protein
VNDLSATMMLHRQPADFINQKAYLDQITVVHDSFCTGNCQSEGLIGRV